MVGYIIGLILGILIFLLQNFKPTSGGFRIMFFITSILFFVGMGFAGMGWWNLLLIPVGVLVLAYISAFCFPYSYYSSQMEYDYTNGHDYFNELSSQDKIGRISPEGFKQTYDRIMGGILMNIVSNQHDYETLGNALYSNNFYPISEHTKEEVLAHIRDSIESTARLSNNSQKLRSKAFNLIPQIFNTFVSVMAIHEEATRNIERLHNETK